MGVGMGGSMGMGGGVVSGVLANRIIGDKKSRSSATSRPGRERQSYSSCGTSIIQHITYINYSIIYYVSFFCVL